MSIIKHKYINSAKKKTINKKKTKYKPINKTVRIGNKNLTDIITKRLPKSDSIESSDNSSYNSNNPSSSGYTNNSVSDAADKQYRRVSRNNESIGLADDPNRANYNDDWNRGMTDKSTDVVSDENKKTFVKSVIKRDPLNRTITKKIISKRGM